MAPRTRNQMLTSVRTLFLRQKPVIPEPPIIRQHASTLT
jgi:hypothetical protein